MEWKIILAFVIGGSFGMVLMGLLCAAGWVDKPVKRIALAVLAIGIVAFITPAWAGEKEELVLKQQLLQEDLQKYEMLFQFLRRQFRDATAELEVLNKRLVEIQKKEEAEKKQEQPK